MLAPGEPPAGRAGAYGPRRARGRSIYVGTYLAVGVNGPGWWGEGEVKFYPRRRPGEFPTICGTGTEDYFGGAWDFDVPGHGYTTFSSSYLGMHQFVPPDSLYRAQTVLACTGGTYLIASISASAARPVTI